MTTFLNQLSARLGLNLRYFIQSGSWVTLRYVLLGASSLLLSIAFARLGTKTLYGQYQFVLALIGGLSVLTLPGLNTVVLKAVTDGTPGILQAATRLCFRLSWLLSFAVLGIGIFYRFNLNEPLIGWALIGASLVLPFFYGPNAWYTVYEGTLDFRTPTLRILALNIITTAILIIGLWQHWSVTLLVTAYFLINGLLTSLYYREAAWRTHSNQHASLDVRSGVTFTVQKLSSMLPETLQPLLITAAFGYEALAIFAIAYGLINSAGGFIGALSATYFPLILKHKTLNHQRILMQNVVLGFLLALGYWFAVTVVFIPLYGTGFQESFSLAQFFSGILVTLPLRYYFASYFTATSSGTVVTVANLVALLASITTFLFLQQANLQSAFIGYVYTAQLTAVAVLGIAYWRTVLTSQSTRNPLA